VHTRQPERLGHIHVFFLAGFFENFPPCVVASICRNLTEEIENGSMGTLARSGLMVSWAHDEIEPTHEGADKML
jgi:hypothetical protein